MKFFTKQLWIDAQQGGDAGDDAGRRWSEAFDAYAAELESLRTRLPADVFAFFQSADVHDGKLMHVRIRDFAPPAPQPAASPIADDGVGGPWEGAVSPLFCGPGDGFEDWGFHELSDAGEGPFATRSCSRPARSC